MPKTARKISILIVAAILAVFIPFLIYRHALDGYAPKPGPGYIARCGGSYVMWMLACAASASLASFIHGANLIYTEYTREKGHTMNGLTLSHAVASIACGLAFSLVFWNLRNAPCFVTPLFYGIVVVALANRAVHTMRMTPTLRAMPNYKVEELTANIQAGEERIKQLQDSGGQLTPEENLQFSKKLEEIVGQLREFRATAATMGNAARQSEGL